MSTDLSRLTLGVAPDSWGIWFASDPHQVTWERYLDEVKAAGYLFTELGPPGFLPQDPARLRDELAARQLAICGGTVSASLHHGAEALARAKEDFAREARLLREVGAEFLIALPEQYTDQHGGAATDSSEIDAGQWRHLVTGINELARYLLEESGVTLVFHPHADTHVDTQDRVERFLQDTDPALVNLCLDTGHIAYCGGDNLQIIERYPERISYVHLKQVDPAIRERVRRERLSMAQAVALRIMCEPPLGEPAYPPVLEALAALDRDIYAVVEQDLYPVEPDVPLPIQARTVGYLHGCGLGPVRRWP